MKVSIEIEVPHLGVELRGAKHRMGKTYRAIAEEAGMTPEGVARVLKEENKVTPFTTLLALEDSLKVSIADLVRGAVKRGLRSLNILGDC